MRGSSDSLPYWFNLEQTRRRWQTTPQRLRSLPHGRRAPCVGNRPMQSIVSGGTYVLDSSAGSSFAASSRSGRTWWTLRARSQASDRSRRRTAHGACRPGCAANLLSAALWLYCPAVLERRRVAMHIGGFGENRPGDRTHKTKAKVRRDHLIPSPSLSRRERDRRPPLPQLPNPRQHCNVADTGLLTRWTGLRCTCEQAGSGS